MNNRKTILLADNDAEFLQSAADFLRNEGFDIEFASNPSEARDILEKGHIDLAILDVRLENDNDHRDTSGLRIAKEVAPSIPKIVLSRFPTFETIREALKLGSDGLPTAVDFVAKEEGSEKLMASVRRSLAVYADKHPKRVIFDLSEQLEKDYEEARKQAVFTHRIRLVLVVVGSVVIIAGAGGVLMGQTTAGALSALSGIVVEALAGLFSKISEDANKRMDKYHDELLKLYTERGSP